MAQNDTPRLLTGSALKWIAIVTMLLDHIGATVVLSGYRFHPTADRLAVYTLLREIGRWSFPIYCFLLVEGFAHTHDRRRYALRLAVFALVSEIPFDMAFRHPPNGFFERSGQNVFFTLLLGLLALWLMEWLGQYLTGPWQLLAVLVAAVPACKAADWLHTDYHSFGVALIVLLGIGRGLPGRQERPYARTLQAVLGTLAVVHYCYTDNNWIEVFAVAGLLLCAVYNGQRGRGGKWFSYVFYPAHLLTLALMNRAAFGVW